ncbi:hypothetical protein V1511DRAFT_371125 [Dipodascopsis uninucleata]
MNTMIGCAQSLIIDIGYPEYGATINPTKSLTNFECDVSGISIQSIGNSHEFPYCGFTIDTRTLEIRKDLTRFSTRASRDIINVEYCRRPNHAFAKKMSSLMAFLFNKYLADSDLNSKHTILQNLYRTFVDIGIRFVFYAKFLRRHRAVTQDWLQYVIIRILSVANERLQLYTVNIDIEESKAIGYRALLIVLSRKPAGYQNLIVWLNQRWSRIESRYQALAQCISKDNMSEIIVKSM